MRRGKTIYATTTPRPATLPAPPPQPLRVVLADDSAAIRLLARLALTSAGLTVVGEAADGRGALDLIEQTHPDVVILDLAMPVLDGLTTLAELRQRTPELPVVMLSGDGDQVSAQAALAAGACAYVAKTGDLSALALAVRTASAPATMPAAAAPTPRAEPVRTDELDTARADLSRFEYIISHDLAAPLRTMSGFAALLQRRHAGSADETERRILDFIAAGAATMQTMIDALLTYSRAGRAEIGHDEVPLGPILGAALSRHSLPAPPDAIGGLPTVLGDRDMLVTLFDHLIDNALLFNSAAEPTVDIAASVDGDRAHITVSDNGIGIEKAHHDRVFELFQRLHTAEEYPGPGAGLALCKRIVTRLDGAIDLDSSPGIGTTITVHLPLAPGGSR